MNKLDIETINLDDLPSNDVSKRSTNFGPGIELLMNTKQKSRPSTPGGEIGLDDLDVLEEEMNKLADDGGFGPTTSDYDVPTFTFDSPKNDVLELGSDTHSIAADEPKIQFADDFYKSAKDKKQSTWDGFTSFDEIPANAPRENFDPKMSSYDLHKEKKKYLRLLEKIEKSGISLSKEFTMNDSLESMKAEYDSHEEITAEDNAKRFYGKCLTTVISGLEFLNQKFDPFDLKLNGWCDQVTDNLEDDYDSIFAELHQKYKHNSSMAPELKLLFTVAGSAIMLHAANSLFQPTLPGMEQIMRQNPALAQQFTQVAAQELGKQNPGLGGFMGAWNNNTSAGKPKTNIAQPDFNLPPYEPQKSSSARIHEQTMRRPDLYSARSEAVDLQDNYMNPSAPSRSSRVQNMQPPATRPEMKGPSNIDDILSGLKRNNPPPSMGRNEPTIINVQDEDNTSRISVSEMEGLSGGTVSMPKKSKRKRSDKNIASLDL